MTHLVTYEGKQIYFEHYPGTGLTVVLSHGWGMASPVWVNTVARLVDAGYGVAVYDHRCCGQSDKDFSDVGIETLGSDLVALVDHLSLDRVVLNGWSLGGAVVTDAAAKLGSRCAGLVHTGAASPRYTQAADFPLGGQPEDVEATIQAARADRINFLKGLYFNAVFAVDVGEDIKHWCWQLAVQASPAADASLRALAHLDQRHILEHLEMPLLVFTGTEDQFVPAAIGRAAVEMTPKATLVELDGCGHAPFLEMPEAYHDALLSFLGDLR
jgi:pimeloyl-[acyl-carrier protein] methyl ester esterase